MNRIEPVKKIDPLDLPELAPDLYEETLQKRAYDKRVERAGIPTRYQDCTFTNIKPPDDEAKRAYDVAHDYATNFPAHLKKGEGILFAGGVGRMKTTLSCAIAYSVLQQGYGVYFMPMAELLDQIVEMSKGDRAEYRRFLDRVNSVSLLILDDMGMEYPSGWVLNKVDAIITHRYNNLKPTIITTNLSPAEMKGRYADRVFDRLRSTCAQVIFEGKSLRKDVKND